MINKLKNLVSGKNSLVSAATILILTTLASNVLGLLRDRFFAQKIPTDLLDTYFAAFRIPDFVFNILILGTITAAFIPVFLEYREKNKEDAWRVVHIMLGAITVSLLGISVLLLLLMPYLVPLLVPDFSAEKQSLTVELARIMLFQPIFFGFSYLFSGVLNALKRFFVYALAPLVYTAAIIISTLLFADQHGPSALVWGVVAGSFLHMAIQLLVAKNIGLKLAFSFDFSHPAFKKILRLMVPRSIGLGMLQAMLLTFTAIASALGPGAVAIYSLADNIQTMPTAVFGLSFITAMYPTMSENVAQKKIGEFAHLIWRGIRYLIVLLVPAGIGLILLRSQTVRLILGTGHFGWEQTILTADTLGLFSLSLFSQALVVLISRAFYALHDTKTPTVILVIGYLISIGLGWWFAPVAGLDLGVPGLALAFSLGSFVSLLILYLTIRGRVSELAALEKDLGLFFRNLFIAGIALVAVVQLEKIVIGGLVDMGKFWGVFVQTAGAIVVGSLVYLWLLQLLNVPEIELIKRFLLIRFFKLSGRQLKNTAFELEDASERHN
ncbi:murein biosynthesis integral membrane protein MurJ [Candidatus Berkelbacteria bacterium]|nr:murein biosynthesis integral membrane protein MurJ [Candidatus Berkelbacteria bacterium]